MTGIFFKFEAFKTSEQYCQLLFNKIINLNRNNNVTLTV